MLQINVRPELIRQRLDPGDPVRHSPPMRWLLLINLLAVVLLSGAVAIVLEGTPVGIGTTGSRDEDRQANLDETVGQDLDQLVAVSEPTPEDSSPAVPDALEVKEPLSGEDPAELELLADKIEDGAFTAPDVPLPLPAPRDIATQEPELSIPVELGAATVDDPSVNELAEPEFIEAPRPLKIATEGDFAPFNFLNEKGEASGFDVDVAKELCRRLTRECIFEIRGWADLVPSLQRGDVDIIAASMRIPSARPTGLAFSDPYYGSRGRFVTARGAAIAGIGALQASGAQIAVQQGSLHEAYLLQNHEASELVAVTSLDAALQLVDNGTVEAAFGDNAAILEWMKNTNCCAVLGPAVTDTKFFGDGIGLVLRDDASELTAAINKHLQEMVTDGTSATLSERYFSGSIY
jgi:ABC-type amino acid transport substrate-binding protein